MRVRKEVVFVVVAAVRAAVLVVEVEAWRRAGSNGNGLGELWSIWVCGAGGKRWRLRVRRRVGGVKRRLGGGLSIVVMGAVELMLEACQWDLVREVVWRLFGTSPVPGRSPKIHPHQAMRFYVRRG